MNKQNHMFDESPGLDGPDYVALVIEWDDIADTIEDEITAKTQMPQPAQSEAMHRPGAASPSLWASARHALQGTAGKAIAAVAALLVARWGMRRLRHA